MITSSVISRYMALNKMAKSDKISITDKKEFLSLKEKYVASLASNPKQSVTDADVERINVLSKKLKAEGLSPEEDAEFVTLRLAYVLSYKRNVVNQMNNIDIVDENNKVENLGEKYGDRIK